MYKQAIGRKNRLTSFLRNDNYERLSKRPNVTIYTGMGSFISANTIKVTLPEGYIELQGKEIFINTGSTPIIPAIDGIQQSQHVYTSSTLLDLSVLPHHLIIIGGGYIGLELASMYAGFGSKVTILEGSEAVLSADGLFVHIRLLRKIIVVKQSGNLGFMHQRLCWDTGYIRTASSIHHVGTFYDGHLPSAVGKFGSQGFPCLAESYNNCILVFLGIFFPKVGLAGDTLAIIMTLGTLSFLVTTPEVWVPDLGSGEFGFP